MAIYSFWIYDRHCNCIYSREWSHFGNNTNSNINSNNSNSTVNISNTQGNTNNNSIAGSNRGSIGSNVGINLNNSSHVPVNSKSLEIAISSGTVNLKNEGNEAKLLFGTLFSIRKIVMNLAPGNNNSNNNNHNNGENVRNDDVTDFNRGSLNKFNELKSFSTLKYKCHFYESLSGLKFILLSDPNIENLQFALIEIYNKYYLNYITRNPLIQVEFRNGEVISNPVFIESVDNYISTLPSFIS